MHAAVLIGSIDDYGANRVLLQDLEALAEAGARATVVAPADAVLSEAQVKRLASLGADLETYPLHVFRRADLRRSVGLPLTLPPAARSADMTIAYTLAVAGYLPLLRLHGIASVLSAHEVLRGAEGAILRALAAQADRIVVNSMATARGLGRRRSQGPRTTLIYPSLPCGDAPVPPDTSSLHILVAARISPSKGQADAVRAVREARAAGVPIKLTLAGGPFPGQEQWLESLHEEIAGDPGIRYAGDVGGIDRLLARCNAVVIPSRRPESFGLVGLEAWCAGRRAIAPAEGGALEAMWLVDGLTYQAREHRSLARQLIRLWEHRQLLATPDRRAPAAIRCDPAQRVRAWKELLEPPAAPT